MKKLFLIIAVIAGFGTAQTAEAHALWIESNSRATKHKAHEVNIFYGEYPSGVSDSTARWYSDLKNLEVWVLSPSQKKTKLELKDLSTHLSSSFIPDEDGIYYVSSVHTTKDLGGTTKYEFSSVVPVLTGKAPAALTVPEQPLSVLVQPNAYKTNELIRVQAWKGGQAFAGGEVLIMSPEGWVKTVKTDENGQVSFTPKLKGSYVIETSDYKKEAGEWNAKPYTHTWKGTTARILVN
ncbi:DUF4198 domain-containing protein [Daejeonella sp. JGW-45]|uniref:DUF4198 domain-containing protein n=1 Tax=Daejeonella sp. JGW-45 TaxID=3034148 RepID=UPI0023EDA48C|nr:DUF4198 domain-containing protein [Daejeonella sp. JGW-45]